MCDDSWTRETAPDDSALSLILRKYISICGFLWNAKWTQLVKLPEGLCVGGNLKHLLKIESEFTPCGPVRLGMYLGPIWGVPRDSNLVDSASSIRLSQRLSHACLSINDFILWNCEWLIISVIVYLMVLTTWITVVILELIHAPSPDFEGVYLLDGNQCGATRNMVIHNNFRIDLSMHHSSFCPISFGW